MSSNDVANQIVNILDLLGGEAGLTSISTLRDLIGAPKKTFDSAIREIYKEISMHDHDHPSELSAQAKKDAYYEDGKYYIGIKLQRTDKARARNADTVANIIREIMFVLGPERGAVPLPTLKEILTPVTKKIFDSAVVTLRDEGVVELDAVDSADLDSDGLYRLVDGKYIGISKT